VQPFFLWKSNMFTYYEFVSVALVIQHATGMRHIVIYGLPRSTEFFHIISKMARFKKKVIEHKMCVSSISTIFVGNMLHCKKN